MSIRVSFVSLLNVIIGNNFDENNDCVIDVSVPVPDFSHIDPIRVKLHTNRCHYLLIIHSSSSSGNYSYQVT